MVLTSIPIEELLQQVRMIVCEELEKYHSQIAQPILSRPITQKELCNYLDVSVQTIIRWKNKKKIPFMNIGSSVRFDLQKVLDALEQKKRPKTAYYDLYKREKTEALDSSYLKAQLNKKGFKVPQMDKYPKLIELQKNQILLKREIKNHKEINVDK